MDTTDIRTEMGRVRADFRDLVDSGLHPRRIELAVHGQVGDAEEQNVWCCSDDLLERFLGLLGLDLGDDDGSLCLRTKVVAQVASAVGTTGMGQADGSRAVRCVPAHLAQLGDLRGAMDGREMYAGSAGLEQPSHETALSGGNPYEPWKLERAGMTKKTERIDVGELRVLEIDDGKVESRRSNEVDDLGGRELDEESSSRFAEVQHL